MIGISYSEQLVYLLNKGFYNVNKYQNKENGRSPPPQPFTTHVMKSEQSIWEIKLYFI